MDFGRRGPHIGQIGAQALPKDGFLRFAQTTVFTFPLPQGHGSFLPIFVMVDRPFMNPVSFVVSIILALVRLGELKA